MKKIFICTFVGLCFSVANFCRADDKVEFQMIDIKESCYILSTLTGTPQFERLQGKPFLEEKLIIENQHAYEEFQKTLSKARNMACSSVEFPQIDFSKHTLLANWATGSCAAKSFYKTVFQNNLKKEITYSVEVISDANVFCSGPGLQSYNLITIPKVADGFKVVFVPPTSDRSRYRQYSSENGKTIVKDWNGNIVSPQTSPPPGGGVFGVQFD